VSVEDNINLDNIETIDKQKSLIEKVITLQKLKTTMAQSSETQEITKCILFYQIK